jgi:sialate O-acetylesterase
MKTNLLVSAALLTVPFVFAQADVKLPAIISDHMVLEKTAKAPIWGKADPGEEVTVTFDGQSAKATTGADGRWKVDLNLANSGVGPFEMTVQGKNNIKISDIVVGEVWVASGQSNMEWHLINTIDAEKEIAKSANPFLRQFLVQKSTSLTPLDDCKGAWVVATPETTPGFTAVGYFFGKKLQQALKTPVGLINTSWGGTHLEAWTSVPAIDSVPDLKAARENLYAQIAKQPEDLQRWITAFGEWLKQTGREDRATVSIADFAAPGGTSSIGWEKVTIPGPITGKKLSGNGAVWIRTEIGRTEPATASLGLELGAIEGFDSVYWNGELVTSLNYREYPGSGYVRRWGKYSIPTEKIEVGNNTLAIRIYAPAGLAKLPSVVKVGGKPVTGDWIAKEEFSLPPLTATQLAATPQPPANLPARQNIASQLFNGMINPIVPFAISGVIWYQGESNAGRSYQYRTAFPLMISDWRRAWDQGDFPFYFCQLASFQPKKDLPSESGWAELREAQSMTLRLPKTGQAVLIDIGESGDVHPRNKKDVGERLALIALANDYGQRISFSGPVYDTLKIEGAKVRVTFKHTDGGLVAKPVPATYDVVSNENKTEPTVRNSPHSELEGFAVCGEDKKWVWANAKIEDDSVLVWSDKVAAPVAVRYGWADNPTVNLFNAGGLPASPFRTDDFPTITRAAKYK